MTDIIAAGAPPAAPTDGSLRHALLDSRQRWRDLVRTAADLAYETDAWGRFAFVMPDPALGWAVATLIDQPAELLLAGGIGANGFNPFRVTVPVRRHRAWLKRADGSPVLLAVSAAPLIDAEGRIVGTRGMGVDWSEYDDGAARVATSLRRGEVLDHILWRIGGEVLAPRMMQAALDALVNAIGAEGAAVIDIGGEDGLALVHRAGGGADEVLAQATAMLAVAEGPTDAFARMDGRSWSLPVARGSAPMPASRCGDRPDRVAGTVRTSCWSVPPPA
jgi:hypothetical protein